MRWKPAIKTAAKGGGIGFVLLGSLAYLTYLVLVDIDDHSFLFAISFAAFAPIGAVFGAVIGGIYRLIKSDRSTGVQDAPQDTRLPPGVIEISRRPKPRTQFWRRLTAIAAGLVGAAAALVLWYLASHYLPLWFGLVAESDDFIDEMMSNPLFYVVMLIWLILALVMPALVAGLGALGGAKLVLLAWPQARPVPTGEAEPRSD